MNKHVVLFALAILSVSNTVFASGGDVPEFGLIFLFIIATIIAPIILIAWRITYLKKKIEERKRQKTEQSNSTEYVVENKES